MLLGDRSLNNISFSCFWTLFLDSKALTVIEYLPYISTCLIKKLYEVTCTELEIS